MALALTLGEPESERPETTAAPCVPAPRPKSPPGVASIPAGAPITTGATPNAGTGQVVLIRVNQVGYPTSCRKLALVMSQRPLVHPTFQITDPTGTRAFLKGTLGASRGGWNPRWGYVYPLDFSGLQTAGRYVIEVAGARSPPFALRGPDRLYGRLAENAVRFFQAQRDGPRVIPGALSRQPSHLHDAHAAVYRRPLYNDRTLLGSLTATGEHINAVGGWFDAGDYLKFVETASFSEVMMLWTLRDYGAGLRGSAALTREARYGLDWLFRMWDQRRHVLYYQVGLGDGNGTAILGDHDFWRLPQADDRSRARPGSADYFVANRPVFAANSPGGPISPNLAGRVAAAFGLCVQVFIETDPGLAARCARAGETIYAQADTNPGPLLSTSPHAYYGGGIWQDDMELGGIELYFAARAIGEDDPRREVGRGAIDFLNQAGRWADEYATSNASGQDTLNIFDLAPLGHYDIARALRSGPIRRLLPRRRNNLGLPTDARALLQDLHDQLALAAQVGQPDPFRLANLAGNTDTVSHALGVAIQSRLYDLLTNSSTFEGLAATQLDWVLGANPWGSSFVVGAGTVFPQCTADQIANLSGSLDGRPPLLLGATINGPNDPVTLRDRGAPDGYRPCPADGVDHFAAFNTPKLAYIDNVTSATTSEPSDDFAALSLMAFAQAAHSRA